MRILCLLHLFLLLPPALGAPSVLVYHDVAEGYGNAVLEAIDILWPDCVPEIYEGMGGQGGFNTALDKGSWDVVVLECWQAGTNGIDWGRIESMYVNDESEFFVYNWHWYGSSAGQFQCFQTMGICDLAVSSYNLLMEVWDPGHPIVQGISDWSQHNVYQSGFFIRQIKLICATAYPIAGWGYAQEEGGICIAEDGESIVSGYCPAYSLEAVDIWINILEFLYHPDALDRSTWGEIKASFL